MKKIFLIVNILILCASMIFFISKIEIQNTQNQEQSVYQVVKNENLNIVNTSGHIPKTNYEWVFTNFNDKDLYISWFNNSLNYYQQETAKVSTKYTSNPFNNYIIIFVTYLELKKNVDVKTNHVTNRQFQEQKTSFRFSIPN
jgi:hypothetical protein